MKFKYLIPIVFLMIISIFRSVLSNSDEAAMIWPSSSLYESTVEKLPISVKDAHQLLLTKTKGHSEGFFSSKPIFIVGDEYYFAKPSKAEASINGFFVNGKTGRIEHRKSDFMIKARQKKLIMDSSMKIEVIYDSQE